MSALGQKQTCAVQKGMSALPPKATSNATYGDVCFGSKTACPLCPQERTFMLAAFDQYLLGKRCCARQNDPDFGELAWLRLDLDRAAVHAPSDQSISPLERPAIRRSTRRRLPSNC